MAEPKAAAEPEQKKGGSLVSTLILIVGAVLVAALGALAVFAFVIRPRLNADPEVDAAKKSAEQAVALEFEEAYVNIVMEAPASILMYKVTFECANPETAALIGDPRYKPRFIAMIRQLHSYKSREEVNDPLLEESIGKQILQEANALLGKIQPVPNPDIRVTAVIHEKLFAQDM